VMSGVFMAYMILYIVDGREQALFEFEVLIGSSGRV